MISTDTFYKDKEAYQGDFSHIAKGITDPQLLEIDNLYGYASGLSKYNSAKYHRHLFYLSILGGVLTLVYLIYDQVSLHGIIFVCGILILYLYLINRRADKSDFHNKYLEYRVLAESLRVQYYLKRAGVKQDAIEILPWPIKRGLPWISEVLLTLPENYYNEKESILDVWIINQKKYHESALQKTEKQNRRNEFLTKTVLYITIFIYIVAILYEIAIFFNLLGNLDFSRVYFDLKIIMGTMSVVTIVIESYYGKLSLSNKINDHKRMSELYRVAEKEIALHGETDEIILNLAREFINENSTWYAYQSKNKPGIII